MRAVDIIIKKKQGLVLSEQEIHFMIDGFVKGIIPEYQMSALLMAICFQGLNEKERFYLTKEMLESGEQIDLSRVNGLCVDKHSTGGVGDKTTLVVAPIIASFGLKMAKMSGRGLGHTGGTLDKLESIPGFNISVSSDDFFKQVNEIGIAVVGQTANITPADKKLYALRDVTGTIESVGLIAGSIMSKKLASGAKNILLDVKVGDGAFMKTLEDAQELAKAMVNIGSQFGRKVVAMLTDMDQPLGEAVGNSLEVIEAIETLKGNGPKDFVNLCYRICSEILITSDVCKNQEEAFEKIKEKIDNGEALNKLKLMIEYQHGNSQVIDNYDIFGKAKEEIIVKAKSVGYVKKIHTANIGTAAMILGAGRNTIEDVIDPTVGIKIIAKKGDYLEVGDPIAIVYTNGKNTNQAIDMLYESYELSNQKINKGEIILDVIGE